MDFKQYKHVIFDLDQTLVKLLIDWSSWQERVIKIIKKYDPDFDQNIHLNMYALHQLIEEYGQDFRQDYLATEIDLETNYCHGYKVIDSSFNLLKKFTDEKKDLYLVTSNCREVVLPILKELKIEANFQKIVTANDVTNFKPSIEPFKLISNDQIEEKEWLMVGDSQSDREFAQNLKIDYLDVRDI